MIIPSSRGRRRLMTSRRINTITIAETTITIHVDVESAGLLVVFVVPPMASKGVRLVNVTVIVFALVFTVEGNAT